MVYGNGLKKEKKICGLLTVYHGSISVRKSFTILVWEFVYNIDSLPTQVISYLHNLPHGLLVF